MTKEQKARAHLARARELIQDTLAFGVNQNSMPLTHAQYNTTGLKDIPRQLLLEILQYLPKEKLTMTGEVNRFFYNANMSIKMIVMERTKKILEAWENDETDVLNDTDLFRNVCKYFPSMFGYASEKLQFLLAKEMFDLDQSCAKAYHVMIPDKIAEFYNTTMRSVDPKDRLERLRKMYQMKLCTDFMKPGNWSESDEDYDSEHSYHSDDDGVSDVHPDSTPWFNFDKYSNSRTEEVETAPLIALSSRTRFRRELNRDKARRGIVMLLATAECSIIYYYNLGDNKQNNDQISCKMKELHIKAKRVENGKVYTKVDYYEWYYLCRRGIPLPRPALEDILEDARKMIEILKPYVLCKPLAQPAGQ